MKILCLLLLFSGCQTVTCPKNTPDALILWQQCKKRQWKLPECDCFAELPDGGWIYWGL